MCIRDRPCLCTASWASFVSCDAGVCPHHRFFQLRIGKALFSAVWAAFLDQLCQFPRLCTDALVPLRLVSLSLIHIFRSRFLALPAKLSPTLSTMGGNQTGIFDELKGAIEEILEEMSDYRVAFAAEDGEDDGEAEKETPV